MQTQTDYAIGAKLMSSMNQPPITSGHGVQEAIHREIAAAASDGGAIRPAEVARRLSAEYPDPGLTPAELAEAVVRAAARAGVIVVIGGADRASAGSDQNTRPD